MINDSMSAIRGLVGRARTRIRLQGALEGATTASILGCAGALAVVYGLRTDALTSGTATILFVACAAIIGGGAALGASRTIDDERVARRIDRASGLSDRLSTAVAFQSAIANGTLEGFVDGGDSEETRELMEAAIRDAVRAAPQADIVAAAPYAVPRDARAAGVFAIVCTALALIQLSPPDRTPALSGAYPNWGKPGAHIVVRGKHLREGATRSIQHAKVDRVRPAVEIHPAGATFATMRPDADPLIVTLGRAEGSMPMKVLDWQADQITVEVPANAPPGSTEIAVWLDGKKVGPVPFTVVDPKDVNYHSEESVAMTPAELDYAKDLIAQIRLLSKDDPTQDLSKFADKLQQMLDQAERGELTKEQLMDALQKAEDELHKGEEPEEAQVNKDLADTGKELEKNQLTKELGQALEKGDLEKAQEEMQKLADKIEKNQVTDQEKQDLSKAMEQAAKAYDQKQQEREQQQKQQQDKAQQDIQEMERRLKDPKTKPEEKQDLERRIEDKQRELKKLQKDEEQKQNSEQRRALKRLHKDMQKAAENMAQKPQNQQQKDQQQQQASRNLKDVARETGRVDQDQRKTAAEKKAASQMDDLREALARAKRRGQKGPEDPFNKQGKESDFAKRAGGGKGSRQAWKQGQGQGQGQQGKGQGQGQGQNGGSGQPNGPSNDWGTGHDPNLTGDPTAMSGNDSDKTDQGVQGKGGSSKRETILAAAQKGFASAQYKKVYAEYDGRVEETLHEEKVPPAYKYYVKKYFNKIKPHEMPQQPAP